jgi:hypothetical protein
MMSNRAPTTFNPPVDAMFASLIKLLSAKAAGEAVDGDLIYRMLSLARQHPCLACPHSEFSLTRNMLERLALHWTPARHCQSIN